LIAGRQDEIGILNKVLASEEAEFIAVDGRCRVGKTGWQYGMKRIASDSLSNLYEVGKG